MLGTALADLSLAARGADAFVGTASSWFSRLELLAIIGRRAIIPPFVFVDRPMYELWSVHPKGDQCAPAP